MDEPYPAPRVPPKRAILKLKPGFKKVPVVDAQPEKVVVEPLQKTDKKADNPAAQVADDADDENSERALRRKRDILKRGLVNRIGLLATTKGWNGFQDPHPLASLECFLTDLLRTLPDAPRPPQEESK